MAVSSQKRPKRPDREDSPPPTLPGRDPDPKANLERAIKIGWTLVGVFMTGGIFAWYLTLNNMLQWPSDALDSMKIVAVAATTINVAIWMWFPLDDLTVLRYWVRTRKRIFPGHTGEFLLIMFQMVLLLGMIVGAIAGPGFFGLAGFAVYGINLIGFAYIKRHVGRALVDSHQLYAEQPPQWQSLLLRALNVVEDHWTIADSGLAGWQQKRHFTLTVVFGAVALIGMSTLSAARLAAYSLGILAMLAGEVFIAARRIRRDGQLHLIEEELGLGNE